MPNDVEIRFIGNEDDAVDAVHKLEGALAALDTLIENVSRALGDLQIGVGTVAKFMADVATMKGGLAALEDQANDTSRAVAGVGVASVVSTPLRSSLGTFMAGRTFVGDRVIASPQTAVPGILGGQTDWSGWGTAMQIAMMRAANGMTGIPNRDLREGWPGPSVADAYALALLRRRADSGGSFMGAMGWGQGGIHRMPWFMPWFLRRANIPGAGFGTALGLAGLGTERILGTTAGILGSATGAVAGGALYGLGVLGPMAVGMGTDMAGIGQAGGDIKTVTGDLNKLDQAIQQYGRHSQQAAAAQAQLNLDLRGFSPVARLAVLHASQQSQVFKQMFDYWTGPAERRGAQIIQSGIQTGQAFLPTIGQYAFGNMGIIQKSLEGRGGLFPWLQSPGGGLGIFTQLEQIFQNRLPVAMHAGTQAFEVFMHAVLDAAKNTGGLVQQIDHFFTKLNTPSGLASMDTSITHMIGLFKTWAGLLVQTVGLVYDLFRPAVGLGQDFARQLTTVVKMTRDWLNAAGTRNVLHDLFQAHKDQLDAIFQIIRALLPILYGTVSAFAQIEAVVAKLTVGPLKALASLIESITSHPLADKILGWSAAILIVNRGLGTMVGWLDALIARWALTTAAAEGSAAKSAAALLAEGTAADLSGAKVGALGKAITALGGEGVLARLAALRVALLTALAPIAAAAAAVYILDKGIAKLTGFDALNKAWGSAGFGADNLAKDALRGKNPYPVGTSNYFEWEAGAMGLGRGQHKIGNQSGYVDPKNKAYQAGAAFEKKHGKTAPDGTPVNWKEFVGYHKGEDCSLFTQRVYKEVWGISIPRTSEEQFKGGMQASGNEVGDLLFYNGYNRFKPPGHVALYIGHGNVIQDNGSGQVQIMPASALDGLGYMGAKTYLKQNAIGTGGSSSFNPGGQGYNPGSPRVPTPKGAGAGAGAVANLPIGLQTAIDKAATTKGTADDLKALDNAINFVQHKIHALIAAHASLKKLDPWYRLLASLQGDVRSITGVSAHPSLASASSIFRLTTEAQGIFGTIGKALHPTFGNLIGQQPINPAAIMGMTPLADAEKKWDPLLLAWRKQLRKLEDELHQHGLTAKMEAEINARMDRIKNKVVGAFTAIKAAAQTQLQAAQTAWQTFTSAFDNIYQGSGSTSNSDLTSRLLSVLQRDQMAVNIDKAQSAILGGKPDTSMAQQVINDVSQVVATVNGKAQPYTQQQIDNWLALWGDYYAKLGYTPQQMYDAFNKLLKSVGLPTIDNPFSTGGLPLPPGTAGASGTGTSNIPPGSLSMPRPGDYWTPGKTAYSTKTPAAAKTSAAGGGTTNVTVQSRPHVEIKFEKGLEWLDKHVTVIVDDEIQKQGKKANARARSGRH